MSNEMKKVKIIVKNIENQLFKDKIVDINYTAFVILSILYLNKISPKKDKIIFDKFFRNFIASTNLDLSLEIELFIHTLSDEVFKNICNSLTQIDELEKDFHKVFEYVLSEYKKSDKKGVFNVLPDDLTKFIGNLIPLKNNAKVYNPFAGIATIGFEITNSILYIGQESNLFNVLLAKLVNEVFERRNNTFFLDNPFKNWNPLNDKYDLIFSFPPLDISNKNRFDNDILGINSETILIEKSIDSLSENGSLVLVVADSFLFSSKSNSKALRKKLINNNLIDTVISFPSRMLKHTAISFSILIINNKKKNEIKLVDASGFVVENSHTKIGFDALQNALKSNLYSKFVRLVKKDNIINDNLYIGRYYIEEFEGVKLKTIFKRVPLSMKMDYLNKDNNLIIRVSDLKNDVLDYTLEPSFVPEQRHQVGISYKITTDALLIAKIGNSFKPTLYKHQEGKLMFISSDIAAVNVDSKQIDIAYLVNQLHSENVNRQLEIFNKASLMPKISLKQLLEIKIQLPSLTTQKEEVLSYNLKRIEKKEAELFLLQKMHGINVADENSFLRHQIAGRINNVRGAFSNITKIYNSIILPKYPEIGNLKFDERTNNTFNKYMEIMTRDLQYIYNSTNQKIDLSYLKSTKYTDLNIEKLLEEYVGGVEKRDNIGFTISLLFDDEFLYDNEIVTIKGNEELLYKMFDNIIENAEKHAFIHKSPHRNFIEITAFLDEDLDNIYIEVLNSGKPFPKEYTDQAYFRKGNRTGDNAGSGIGGWLIGKTVDEHNGYIYINNNPDTEINYFDDDSETYTTSINMTFPIIIKYKE